jgi:hypothetical protein
MAKPRFKQKRPKANHPDLTRAYVEKAMDDYLKSGGEITYLEITKKRDKKEAFTRGAFGYADNFLIEREPVGRYL